MHHLKRKAIAILPATFLLAIMVLPASGFSGSDEPASEPGWKQDPLGVLHDHIELLRVTGRYYNIETAIADGYIEKPINGVVCVTHEHHGAMGIHYLNPELVGDGEIQPLEPEVLLYEPTAAGLRLVGVEYFVPDAGQPHPWVFGRPLDGPNQGLEPGMPVHYSLHAWIWEPNPSGMFVPYNPAVSCPS